MRQGLGLDVGDSHFQRQAVGHTLAVTGEQQLPAQPQFAQLAQGMPGLGFDAVGQQQPTEKFAIKRQAGNRPVVPRHRAGVDTQLAEQLRAAKGRFALLGTGHHPQALAFMNVPQWPLLFLGHQPARARLTGWLLAEPRLAARVSRLRWSSRGLSMACKRKVPYVRVPVLSTTREVRSASSSRKAELRIRMPWRAATAIPAMAVAGADSTNAQGQAATSTASMAWASLVMNQVTAANSNTSTM